MINSHLPYYAPFLEGSDLVLWLNLDPDYRTTATTVNDWKNYKKVSDVFSQSNASRRPTDNGTHITFDGGDNLACNVDRVLDVSATGWTVCSRYTETDWTSNSTLASDNDTNNSFIKNVGNSISVKATGTSGTQTKVINFDAPTNLVDSQIYNIAVTCTTAGLLTVYIDGVAQADTATFGDDTYDITMSEVGGKNGNSWMMVGDIQEIIVYHRPLSQANITDLNTYLNNKF